MSGKRDKLVSSNRERDEITYFCLLYDTGRPYDHLVRGYRAGFVSILLRRVLLPDAGAYIVFRCDGADTYRYRHVIDAVAGSSPALLDGQAPSASTNRYHSSSND